MQSTARVVIIGGGMFGVSLLYHLAKEGWSDIVLVEKGELTSGSTWHAAGQCPNFVGSLSMGHIHHYGTQLYPALEAETGQSAGWHGCGGLRLALTDQDVEWFKYVEGVARLIGYGCEIIGPSEIKQYHPHLETFGVKAAYRTVTDGHVDPTSAANALAIGARNHGASIYRHTRATGVERTASGEWLVRTEKGDIRCDHVVNAAGSYCDQVAAWSGLKIPMVNMVHQYLVTEPLDEIKALDVELPVVRDPYSDAYLRQEQNGLLIGPYETSGAEICFADGVPWSFDQELFEPDIERLMPWLERCTERMPLFGKAGIKRVVSGPITHLPDGGFLLGPAPGLKNYWMACGSSIGICQGAGAGKYLAQQMVHGSAEINMNEFDPRRYGDWSLGDYAFAKGIDEYQHMYAPHLPGEHRCAGRPVRTTSLYEKLKAKGAHYAEIFGWERPKWFALDGADDSYGYLRQAWFDAVGDECKAVREAIGVMDLSSFAKFEVRGAGALDYLSRIMANNLPRSDGRIVLSHFLDRNGRILGEATVTRLAKDRFYILSGAGCELRDLDNLVLQVESGEDVAVDNVTDHFGMLVVGGPRSRDVLSKLTQAPLSSEYFPWLSGQEIDIAGISIRALRVGYIGELGWELHCPIDRLADLYEAVWRVGAEFGIRDFGSYAMNSLRLEKAYRGYGAEMTNEVTLSEASMERFIAKSKDYVGKCQQTTDPRIKLVHIEIEASGADCHGNEPVYAGDRLVGVTTSGGYGYAVKRSLAFAYVEPDLARAGNGLDVLVQGERVSAAVLCDALYDPHNERLRA